MSAVATREVEANGWRFRAEVGGPPDGALVLLLHGFPQTRATWRAELPALVAAGYRVCAPDQRGYSPGARPGSIEDYRVEALVADVLALADAMGADRFHLVGHDWGGHLAWITAALHPARVHTLAVLSRPHPASFATALQGDPQQAGRSGHHRAFQRAEVTDALLADGAARLRSLYAADGVPSAAADVYVAALQERAALDAAIHWYRAAPGSALQAAAVPPVKVPTLYVWGDADPTVGRLAAEGTRDRVEAAYRFVELPGVGHFVTDQAPEAFPPLLLAHLAAHGAT